MLIPCPNCKEEMYISSRYPISKCFRCAYEVKSYDYAPEAKETLRDSKYKALTEMRRARLARQDNERESEIVALKNAIGYDPSLIKAYIRLGRILPDVRERRKYLMMARRLEPENMEALTLLAQLHANLSPERAAQLFGDEAPVKAVETMATDVQQWACPSCRGYLEPNLAEQRLECANCGYSEALESAEVHSASVLEEMYERTGGVTWEIGGRLVHCQTCQAEWTYHQRIARYCPYCHSQQVAVKDQVGSFQLPDGLIGFEVTERQALAALQQRLKHFSEKVKALFDPNTLKRAQLEAVYLPFWVFDHEIDIRVQAEFDIVAFKHPSVDPTKMSSGSSFDLGICAVTSVPSQLTNQLGYYYRHQMLAYQAAALDYPAEIYQIPLDKALLRARTMLSGIIETRAARESSTLFYTDFSETNYQLVLAPVWLATLYEIDGDIRPALVNGQSGKVVLGRAKKAN